MDWIKLAIPLIAVAVWIVSNLANQQKEQRKLPRVPPPPAKPRDPHDPLATEPVAKPDEDNKYREEMQRKREKKPVVKTLPRPRPTKRPEIVLKPSRLPTILVPAPAPVVRREEPPPLPAPLPAAPEQVAKVSQPAVVRAKPKSAAIRSLHELLGKRENLTTAFLLKEVLDLPVSKRPKRRM